MARQSAPAARRNVAGVYKPPVDEKRPSLPAVQGIGGQLSDEVLEEADGFEGAGYSDRADDSLVPILSIIQDNSGEVKSRHERKMEGVEAGMLIVRSLKKVWAGDGTLILQPCAFVRTWVEWDGEPGEGVPVGQYAYDSKPEDAEEYEDPNNPGRMRWRRRESGTRLVDTRNHFVNVLDGARMFPAVVPMAGTNHTVSRGWTSLMKQFMLPGTDKRSPAWFRAYAMRTAHRQRGNQSWYVYDPQDMGWLQERQVRDAGRALFESANAGKVQAAVKEMEDGDGAGTGAAEAAGEAAGL